MQEIVYKKSKIHGNGVFAGRGFQKGEVVVRWSAHVPISPRAMKRLPKKEQLYISFIHGKYIRIPPEGRLNHSCDPNVRFYDFRYIAERKILKGEELTTDYRAESDDAFTMHCRCGTKQCRGKVNNKM